MKSLSSLLAIAALLAVSTGAMWAQPLEPIGGPYLPDSNTVLLLHFDGNMQNAAAPFTGTPDSAVRNTTNPAKIYFLPNTGVAGMGQCVRLDNGAVTDSTYLTVDDHNEFDLTGDWTIEAWANIFTFGDNSNDYRWVPRVVMKPGVDVFWHPNYWLEMWGDNRLFHAGYYAENGAFISLSSENNMFTPGQWVHLTFIRDTQRGIIAQMVHDVNKNLLSFTAQGFTPQDIPQTNINPVHIGWAGAKVNASPSTDSWLDGFVDEIRISKVVRNFAGPPLVTNVTRLGNQSSALASYQVSAKIQPFNAGGSITSAMLHYYVTQWDSVPMAAAGVDYTATIPGQAAGSQIKYYVTAMDNNGMRSVVPLTAEKPSPSYYAFWIFQPNVQTLHLTFEEGPGAPPIDHSPNNSTILTKRLPDYSTDAKEGTQSLYLFYTPGGIDSGWVEAESPFLAAEEFCVDFWFKADTSNPYARIICYSMNARDWNNHNYEISFRPNALGRLAITGRYWRATNLSSVLTQDTNAVVFGRWYHVIYERSATTGMVALDIRNENDVRIFRQIVPAPDAPVMGSSGSQTTVKVGRADTDPNNWWFIPPFQGRLDNVQIFNYPSAGVTGVDGPGEESPWTFALMQNYPNPFNPTTRIQFVLPSSMHAELVVYDVLGRRVKTIVNEVLHAGPHYKQWDGTNEAGRSVSTGSYFYRLNAGPYSRVFKMMLVK